MTEYKTTRRDFIKKSSLLAGGEDVLFITDYSLGKVFKTTTDGRTLMTIDHPKKIGEYEDKNLYVCQWNAGQTYPIKLERV